MATYDFIVVGGGSAGSLVAGRLATQSNASVLLLEAGRRDLNPLIHIPAGFTKLIEHNLFLWQHHTAPQIQLDGGASAKRVAPPMDQNPESRW